MQKKNLSDITIDEFIERFKEIHITKEDLQNFVTKKDLKESVEEVERQSTKKIQETVQTSIHDSVSNMMNIVNIDINNPEKMQKRMIFIDSQISLKEKISDWFIKTMVGTIILGGITILVLGIKEALHK